MNLAVNLAGIHLSNPLMPGSGPLTGDGERIVALAGLGLGAVVTKTIAPEAAQVVRPCIARKGNVIMNCEAWSEFPAERWIQTYLPYTAEHTDRPVIASVGYCPEDYARIIPRIDHMVAGYECVARFHNNSGDYSEVGACVRAFRGLTDKPIWVKMSGNKPDPVGFGRVCLDNGATGVVAITSLGPCLAVDIQNRRPLIGLSSGYSWASGPAIKPLALSTVFMLKQALPQISIIGSGGIANAEDVLEFLLAGADAVEMLSAAMLYGKQTYQKIIAELPAALEKYGFASIDDVKAQRLQVGQVSCSPSYPEVDEQRCNGCGLCAKNCPYSAIVMQGAVPQVDRETCFGCGLCQSACPARAISHVLG